MESLGIASNRFRIQMVAPSQLTQGSLQCVLAQMALAHVIAMCLILIRKVCAIPIPRVVTTLVARQFQLDISSDNSSNRFRTNRDATGIIALYWQKNILVQLLPRWYLIDSEYAPWK